MNQIAWKGRALVASLMLCISWGASAEMNPNTADINQNVYVPGMSIAINPGGRGCGENETWDVNTGGCSKGEYLKNTARVVQVWAESGNVSIAVSQTRLVAVVRAADGSTVGPGIPVSWSSSAGGLTSYSGVTDGNSEVQTYLSAGKGTGEGGITVSAWAVAGGASSSINAYNSARISSLYATQPSLIADGASTSTLIASLVYENGLPVGAGESVAWTTDFGNLYNIQWTTDGNSQAIAQINSSNPGTATITASRNGALQTQVGFAAPAPPPPPVDVAPIIISFEERSMGTEDPKYYSGSYPNQVKIEEWACYLMKGVCYSNNKWSWNVTGADRYELLDPSGNILYSGTDSWFMTYNWPTKPATKWLANVKYHGRHDFTLRAFKGTAFSEKTVSVEILAESSNGWSIYLLPVPLDAEAPFQT